MNRFLRTAPTRRLLVTLAGIVAVIGAGAAIAVAARGPGPVPPPRPLAAAIHNALAAKPIHGISADVSFTNRLIDSFEIQGSDPLLNGGSGHIWVAGDGRMRLELYGDNGDPEIVVTHRSWWVYDPTLGVVYEGRLPTGSSDTHRSSKHAVPSVAQIQAELNRLARHLNLSGAIPSDVGGQPAYTVSLSSKHAGGLLGQLQLAWDALKGVPLRFAVYARGDATPVLELAATGVSYGTIGADVFNITPPQGAHVVKVAMPAATGTPPKLAQKAAESGGTAAESGGKAAKRHAETTGVAAVARHLSFKLVAPATLEGLSRTSVRLLGSGRHAGALVIFGQGLGGIVVVEQPASPTSARRLNLSRGSGDGPRGIALPTVSIHGVVGQELDTALGTILRFTSGGVSYTVAGSLRPPAINGAARAL